MRNRVVTTISVKKWVVKRWFYLDIQKVLSSDVEREDAVVAMPEDRRLKSNFDKTIDLDLSSPELEYKHLIFPLARTFDLNQWLQGYWAYWNGVGDPSKVQAFFNFQTAVLNNITGYQIPVISLSSDTSHEAVCLVFEKVNTGGKPLDAFELLTAMCSAHGYKLRDDWLGRPKTSDQEAQTGVCQILSEYGRIGADLKGVFRAFPPPTFCNPSFCSMHAKCAWRPWLIKPSRKTTGLPCALRASPCSTCRWMPM